MRVRADTLQLGPESVVKKVHAYSLSVSICNCAMLRSDPSMKGPGSARPHTRRPACISSGPCFTFAETHHYSVIFTANLASPSPVSPASCISVHQRYKQEAYHCCLSGPLSLLTAWVSLAVRLSCIPFLYLGVRLRDPESPRIASSVARSRMPALCAPAPVPTCRSCTAPGW